MRPTERYAWLEAYLSHLSFEWVDVLTRDFVDDYVAATGAPVQVMPYGANKCRQLGRDLARLYTRGQLQRRVTSINGLGELGFPTWVYAYTLVKAGRAWS